MSICNRFKETLTEYNCEFNILVNRGMSDEYRLCDSCFDFECNNGIITSCECCGMYFTPNHLKVNPENGLQEICPYCGEVWCE